MLLSVNQRLPISQEQLADFCQRHHIRRLAVFGSILGNNFGPTSDIDVLVDFEPGARIGLLAYIEAMHDLSDLLRRPVDLVTADGLKPLIKQAVLDSAEVIYEVWPKLYLSDILEAADAIAEFIGDIDEAADFHHDRKTQSAVLQKLIVIGEAAANLSPEMKVKHPHLPWRTIVAFRNVMVHAYFSIQLDIIWETALNDVPALRRQVTQILTDEYP